MEELKHWLFGASGEKTIRRAVPAVNRVWLYLTLEVAKSTGAFEIWATCFCEGIWQWGDTACEMMCRGREAPSSELPLSRLLLRLYSNQPLADSVRGGSLLGLLLLIKTYLTGDNIWLIVFTVSCLGHSQSCISCLFPWGPLFAYPNTCLMPTMV